MYKLLIVDDEPLIQAGIKSMVDWEKIGIEIIGTASNGEQALELIKKKKPEIVITDIKMPVLTGIDLIKRCNKEIISSPQFIVLTSYEDFNILRQVMKFNTVDYLVKLELTSEILIDSVKKAKSNIASVGNDLSDKSNDVQTVTKVFKEIFYIKLLNKVFFTIDEIEDAKKQAGVELGGDQYSAVMCQIKYTNIMELSSDEKKRIMISSVQIIKEILERSITVFILPMDSEHFVIIVGTGSKKEGALSGEDALRTILKGSMVLAEKYYNIKILSGIGSLYQEILSIPNSYREAQTALTYTSVDEQFILYRKIAKSTEKAVLDIFWNQRDMLRSALKCYDIDLLEKVVDKFLLKLESKESLLSVSLDICSSFLYEILTYISNAEQLLAEVFVNDSNGYHCLYEMTTVDQTMIWMKKIKNRLITEFKDKRIGYTEVISDQIKKYIDRHFLEKIELKDLGDHFKMSPNYLCSVFKKYNTQGIPLYQNSKRIEKAKELLKQKSYKIYDISEMTGFESPYYFSKVFKKITGSSPREWLSENTLSP